MNNQFHFTETSKKRDKAIWFKNNYHPKPIIAIYLIVKTTELYYTTVNFN